MLAKRTNADEEETAFLATRNLYLFLLSILPWRNAGMGKCPSMSNVIQLQYVDVEGPGSYLSSVPGARVYSGRR